MFVNSKPHRCPKCFSFDVSECGTWSAVSDETGDKAVITECQCHDCGMAFWMPLNDEELVEMPDGVRICERD